MKTICYNLELKTPVLATDVEGEPNSAVSLPYISGALLRGAMVGRYLEKQRAFDAADIKARALFLGDDTRFLHAYPIIKNSRGVPVPLTWRHDKNDGHDPEENGREINNFSRITRDEIKEIKSGGIKEEAVEIRFAWIESEISEIALLFSPLRQLNVHTQRDARKGRATEEAGAVYRYDALASGLRLRGVILTTDEMAAQIEELLRGATLYIGRARNAGYGEVQVTKVETLDYWRETETYGSAGEISTDDQLQITFTSDALLRNENGQTTLDPSPAIAARLGISPESLTLLPKLTRAGSKVVGGFNRKWGLPLPQMTAITAGSVFTYKKKAALTLEAMDKLEREGIGERRNEGFGRVLVNWHMAPFYLTEKFEFREEATLEALSDDEKRIAEKIVERLLRRQMDMAVRRQVNSTEIEQPPGKSQLSRLRVILRDIQSRQGEEDQYALKRINAYLKNLRRAARRQFEYAKVNKSGELKNLLDWLPEQIEKATELWSSQKRSSMNISIGPDETAIRVAPEAKKKLAQEYALRLVDQVLYRAAKEQS